MPKTFEFSVISFRRTKVRTSERSVAILGQKGFFEKVLTSHTMSLKGLKRADGDKPSKLHRSFAD